MCNNTSRPRPVGDFSAELQNVKEQVEFDFFSERVRSQANEICMIIAEMNILPDNAQVQIVGSKISAAVVRNIYTCLTRQHLEMVIDNYNSVCHRIRFKKTYLRTALYNSVFEMTANYINECNSDGI